MTEHEYEDWFDKYLGHIESLDSEESRESIFEHIPHQFDRRKWIKGFGISLLILLALSCLLEFLYVKYSFWLLTWTSNALLNLSIGVIASLILLLYTGIKERNAAFYAEAIPVLEERYNSMRKAYFDYTFKIDLCAASGDYQGCYEAWHANSNACFVILNFVEYLEEKFPYKTKSLDITKEQIENAKSTLLEVNNKVQREFFDTNQISGDMRKMCNEATYCGSYCLVTIQSLISELKLSFYGVQFGEGSAQKNETNDDL